MTWCRATLLPASPPPCQPLAGGTHRDLSTLGKWQLRIGEWLGVGMSLGEPTLAQRKKKALPELQCHPATCPRTVKHPFITYPSPCQPDTPGLWLLGSCGAPGPTSWLKGRGANPALSCPQLPCAHRGPWGTSPQFLTVIPGRHFDGEEGLFTPGGRRTGKGGGPEQGPLWSCAQSPTPGSAQQHVQYGSLP